MSNLCSRNEHLCNLESFLGFFVMITMFIWVGTLYIKSIIHSLGFFSIDIEGKKGHYSNAFLHSR